MKKSKKLLSLVLLFLVIASVFPLRAGAEENGNEPVDPNQTYYLGSPVNAGKDTGFSKKDPIKEDDPHYGWELGRFFVSGYTRVNTDDKKNPVFLKNVGDKVTLWFNLEQDIKKLNGSDTSVISTDIDGYDEYFGISKTNMGKGTLIIRHTDYQNATGKPQIYTNYLSALTVGADTKVELCEEGDYEVALDYEIKTTSVNINKLLLWDTHIRAFPSYTNYRIYFKFSVRNGNCMVFAFDNTTGDELMNGASTENGFRLNMANSHYLNVDIKKEILNETGDGLVEDTRFNRPAKDGDVYDEEGIYTITVKNQYTNRETEKVLYVGTNSVMKASVTNGLSIIEVEELVAHGATINADGTMKVPSNMEQPTAVSTEATVIEQGDAPTKDLSVSTESGITDSAAVGTNEKLSHSTAFIVILIVVAVSVIAYLLYRSRNDEKAAKDASKEE